MAPESLEGKRVLVVGLGRSGRAAAALARDQGARVVGVDLRIGLAPIDGVVLELGPHRRERFVDADLIVVSPGVPPTQPDLVAAEQAGVPRIGELAFAARYLSQPMIAVTGTNGKSTVTSFVGQLLSHAGHRPFVGGNLGTPLCQAVGADHDVLVVEVSSYQLELPGELAPDVGVVLNLTPDHLARHGTMEVYGRAKTELFARQTAEQWAVLPADDALLQRVMPPHRGQRAWLGGHPGVVREGHRATLSWAERTEVLSLSEVPLLGEHNLDNAATAAFLALVFGADVDRVQQGLGQLVALPHRMEPVGEHDGVVWVNDSKATNLDAARVGIGGLDRPAVVLLGGQAKEGTDYRPLAALLARHRAAVCFGDAGPMMAEQLRDAGVTAPLHEVGDLASAVALARTLAQPGDAVLLSPGGSSFDAFDDFEHRGRVFAALANGRTP
jgi:UDP-N-acetylmuramoylalanine--D-glutamate ligase